MGAVDTSEGGTSIDSGMTNSKRPVLRRDLSSSDMFSRVSPYTMEVSESLATIMSAQ